MNYLVVRYPVSYGVEEYSKGLLMGRFATRWEADQACKVFSDDHPSKISGHAIFNVVAIEK